MDTTSPMRLQIEAVQSVTPRRMTEPRRSRQVLVTDQTKQEFQQKRHHMVLYYKKLSEEDCGGLFAGWTKESLAIALLEEPILGGRLRRTDEDGRLTIVSNDSGIRLVEARVSITLSEFLELKEKENVEEELVFWEDIDEQSPEFCPLVYVQVTNFQCGGYSIGISCGLLLADLLIMKDFLKIWAKLHNKILAQKGNPAEKPVFYIPYERNFGSSASEVNISSTPSKNPGTSLIFNIRAAGTTVFDTELCKELALLCVEEAEKKLCTKEGSEFLIFIKDVSSEVMKVEKCSKTGNSSEYVLELKSHITSASWDVLGAHELEFLEGNKPVNVSCWIGSENISDGLVMAIPSAINVMPEMNIIVTLPNRMGIADGHGGVN